MINNGFKTVYGIWEFIKMERFEQNQPLELSEPETDFSDGARLRSVGRVICDVSSPVGGEPGSH